MAKTSAIWCDRELFRSPVYYGLVLNEAEYEAEMKRLKITGTGPWLKNSYSHATTSFFTNEDGRACALVSLKVDKDRNPIEVIGLLVHEATHIWQEIRKNIGELAPSSEFEAYAMQWISQQLVDAYVTKIGGKHR